MPEPGVSSEGRESAPLRHGSTGLMSCSRRRLLAGGLAAGLAAVGAACERTPAGAPEAVATLVPPALRPPITYVALGASDAAGVGVEDPSRDGWVHVLARRLPQPARLVNLGIPGIKLREAINVALPPALEARANLVTVWLVVNDVLGGVQLSEYRADLDRLLRELRTHVQAYIAVGNVPKAPEQARYLGLPPSRQRVLAQAWNEVIAAVATEHEAILVDLYTRWPLPENPRFIGPDGLHPTAAGYRSLAETFLSVLQEQRIV